MKLMTPGGKPGLLEQLDTCATRRAAGVSAGFHTTVLPISAGAVGRLPPIAVKLNGVSANTKPSSGRSSLMFHMPGALFGCIAVELLRVADVEPPEVDQLARRVDLGLVTRSCDWPCIVAALIAHAPRPGEQLGGAAAAPRRAPPSGIAAPLAPRLERRADRALGDVGVGARGTARHVLVAVRHHDLAELPVRMRWPPTTHGISTTSRSISRERRLEPRALGAAGRVAEDTAR